MPRSVICEVCGYEVQTSSRNQRTCLADVCVRTLRGRTRSRRYYESRPIPICIWCNDPILEPRKRRYHAECRDDKNRLRVRAYSHTTKRDSAAQKKSRDYKQHLCCKYCRQKVKRTGARQIICRQKVCINKLKQANKKRRRGIRNRLVAARKDRAKKTNKSTRPKIGCEVYRLIGA